MADLLYYKLERERWPQLNACKLTFTLLQFGMSLLLRRCFKKGQRPDLEFYGHDDRGKAGRHRIMLGRGASLLTMIHEVAHTIDARREYAKGRPHKRWHSKRHARIVDRLAKWVISQGWDSGGLEAKLVEVQTRMSDRARARSERSAVCAARRNSLETKIRRKSEHIARLRSRIRGLETRLKSAQRSLTGLLVAQRLRAAGAVHAVA